MNFLFLARPSYDYYSSAIYNKYKEKYDNNAKGFFITTNSKESKYIQKKVEGAVVFETSKYLREHWDEFTEEKLSVFEERYDCKPIWSYILTDRFLTGKDYHYVVKITVGLFSFFEEIYKNNSIDVYYSEAIATLQCYISYLVGGKYGAVYLSQLAVRGSLDSTYHYFIDNPFDYDANFDRNYENIVFSEEEIERADAFLKDFEENYLYPPGQERFRVVPQFNVKYLLLPIKRFIKSFDRNFTDKYSYMYYQAYKHITDPVKFYFRYQRAKKYYQKPDYGKKYVYFPLHFQPEASTLVCAPKYENQIVFIDALAKSLPADTVLYVKEHYLLLGSRDLRFYEELKKFPNVVIIEPWENSRELIEKAEAVVTLTGTAGYEAMLLRKPVIIGGNAQYDMAPGVIKLSDVYHNYLQSVEAWEQPSREDVIKFLCAIFRGYRKGNVYAQNYPELLNDNIEDIVFALYQQLLDYKLEK